MTGQGRPCIGDTPRMQPGCLCQHGLWVAGCPTVAVHAKYLWDTAAITASPTTEVTPFYPRLRHYVSFLPL